MKFYHDWAVRIAAGEWTDGNAFYGLPGYAYLLAGIYTLFGNEFVLDWTIVAVLQSILEALTAVLIFKIATRCFKGENKIAGTDAKTAATRIGSVAVAVLASLAYVFFVPAQSFSIILMPTAWLVCAYWWCVWQAMQYREVRSEGYWLGMGAFVGVVAMMIATILFVLPLLLVALFRSQAPLGVPVWKRGRAILSAAVLLTGVGIGTSPAWLHNYLVARDPVLLSAHGGLNFWMGNNPWATGYPKIPEGLRPSQEGLLRDSVTWVEKEAGHPLKRTEVSRYWGAKANAYIREHPGDWFRLLGTKIRNFWNGFQYDDISVITLLRERQVTLPGLYFWMASAFGLAGLCTLLWQNKEARWVGAAVLLHMAALLSVFVTERYRLAAVPGLLILGSLLSGRLVGALQARAWLAGGAYVLLLGATTWATAGKTSDPTLLSLDPYNLGVKELEVAEKLLSKGSADDAEARASREAGQRELEHARAHLEKAFSLLQGNSGIIFALGNLELAEGNRKLAAEWYSRTLALDGHYTPAIKNLGFLAVEGQQWKEADRLLELARQQQPENPTTWYLQAKARQGLGDLETARTLLNEALRLKPGEPTFLALQHSLIQETPIP